MDDIRNNWTYDEALRLHALPFNDLLFSAHQIHRQYFNPNQVQISTILSIKTGACPEDCRYCPQSIHYQTGITRQKLMDKEAVLAAAKKAKSWGASRFCMGAAWRNPRDKDLQHVIAMIKSVKELGLETCLSAGMLNEAQVKQLEQAGLDYYNHNIDTSPEYYKKIISTRTFEDRLETLEKINDSTIKLCCGGIVGLGETTEDRLQFLLQLANLKKHPESVPINLLVKIPGTPLEKTAEFDALEFIRIIAIARIMMPQSILRLSAGRNTFSDELQACCFFAGANSIHYGEKLLTTPLPDTSKDQQLLQRLGLETI